MTIRIKSPSHPGTFVRLMVLEPLDLTVTQAAQALGVTRPALSNFLNGKASLSPEMAIRLDKAFGVDMATLMRMQASFDIVQAQKRLADIDVEQFQSA
jgi:antitoxin HigA-1